MNEALSYLAYFQSLQAEAQEDPILALAKTAAWLDPLCLLPELDYPENEADEILQGLMEGLRICRRSFPAIYVETLLQIREDAKHEACLSSILESLNDLGFDFSHIELSEGNPFDYGIPLPYYGIDPLDELQLESDCPELYRVYLLFGLEVDSGAFGRSYDLPDLAYEEGHLLRMSLLGQADPCYEQLYWYLGWIFGLSGNSSVDQSIQTAYEWQPLDWEEADIALTLDIVQEAAEIMEAALAGEARLFADEGLWESLKANLEIVCRRYSADLKKGRKAYELATRAEPNPYALEWPEPRPSDERETTVAA